MKLRSGRNLEKKVTTSCTFCEVNRIHRITTDDDSYVSRGLTDYLFKRQLLVEIKRNRVSQEEHESQEGLHFDYAQGWITNLSQCPCYICEIFNETLTIRSSVQHNVAPGLNEETEMLYRYGTLLKITKRPTFLEIQRREMEITMTLIIGNLYKILDSIPYSCDLFKV